MDLLTVLAVGHDQVTIYDTAQHRDTCNASSSSKITVAVKQLNPNLIIILIIIVA